MATVEDRAVPSITARQFDFWLGHWDLRWEPDGRGVNEIVTILDDHGILERFDGRPSIPLAGMSVSVFDDTIGRWRQVWVDSDGQYLDFIGGLDGDRMVLERRRADGRLQRMVWSNIDAEIAPLVVGALRRWRPKLDRRLGDRLSSASPGART